MNDPIVESILKERYYRENETCWEDIAWRVAKFIANNDQEESDFYEIISSKKIVPASPFLMNAGTKKPQCFSCFVLPVEDTIESIFKFYADASKVFKWSGGVGVNWSDLRPKGSPLSSGGVTSGVLSFLNIYNELIDTVSQGGLKKGASICLLSTDHAECTDFIKSKLIEGKYKNFNISPVITDEFMEGVLSDEPRCVDIFNLIVDCTYNSSEPGALFIDTINRDCSTPGLGEYESVNPCVTADTLILTKEYGYQPIASFVYEEVEIWNGYEWSWVTPTVTGFDQDTMWIDVVRLYKDTEIVEHINCTPYHTFILRDGTKVKASELNVGDRLIDSNYPSGESAIVHVLKVRDGIKHHKVYCLTEPKNHTFLANGVIIGNCGERPLLPYESCCLTALVLPNFWKNGVLDYKEIARVTRLAIRFLDNSMDKNDYPIPEIKEATLKTRRLGLYVTGFADILLMKGIRYGSNECIEFINKMWKFINDVAWDESVQLGKEKGVFPAYGARDIDIVPDNARNAAVTCLAPSGTTSIIASVNWGIEPVYSFASMRSEGAGQGFIVNKYFEKLLDEKYPDNKQEIIEHCAKTGSIQNLTFIDKSIRDIFVTALDLTYVEHIDVQSAFQRHCRDGSISKTCNLSQKATWADVHDAFIYAWKSGCKGITFYREGTRKGVYQLKKDEPGKLVDVIELVNPVKYKLATANGRIVPKTPRLMNATVNKRRTGCGKLYVIPAEAFGDLHSMFLINKGGCDAMTQTVAELIGSMRRFGVPRWEITRICSNIVCSACKGRKDVDGKSCAHIISKVILEQYPDEDMPPKIDEVKESSPAIKIELDHLINPPKVPCPNCGGGLVYAEGCVSCPECAYTKCS